MAMSYMNRQGVRLIFAPNAKWGIISRITRSVEYTVQSRGSRDFERESTLSLPRAKSARRYVYIREKISGPKIILVKEEAVAKCLRTLTR